MGEVKQVEISSIKKGNYVIIDGVASVASDIQISRPGKHGHAKIRLTAEGIIDGNKRVVMMPGHDRIEVPIIEKRSAQVLSINGEMANIMDAETFETFDVAIPAELKAECVEGSNVLYWDIIDQRILKQIKSD
ncbi:MAG: translation initiation factor IF-5A [Candidatus Nanoarchaeia archaeon]|nr:translation initiation factor IF-5A [Candidatus Nanoarchaeia archaeon]